MRTLLRTDLTTDRRELARVSMKQFGARHTAQLLFPGGFLNALLLDLGPSGARVALKRGGAVPGLARSTSLFFNPLLGSDGQLRQDLPCELRWVAGPRLGLRFTPELGLTASDILALLSLGWRL